MNHADPSIWIILSVQAGIFYFHGVSRNLILVCSDVTIVFSLSHFFVLRYKLTYMIQSKLARNRRMAVFIKLVFSTPCQ